MRFIFTLLLSWISVDGLGVDVTPVKAAPLPLNAVAVIVPLTLLVIKPAPLVNWLVLVTDVEINPAPFDSWLLLVGIVGVLVKLS